MQQSPRTPSEIAEDLEKSLTELRRSVVTKDMAGIEKNLSGVEYWFGILKDKLDQDIDGGQMIPESLIR